MFNQGHIYLIKNTVIFLWKPLYIFYLGFFDKGKVQKNNIYLK